MIIIIIIIIIVIIIIIIIIITIIIIEKLCLYCAISFGSMAFTVHLNEKPRVWKDKITSSGGRATQTV